MNAKTVGLVGCGLLGAALAERLQAAGFAVVGYDVDTGRRDAVLAAGGAWSGGVADVSRRCRRLVLCLPDTSAVQSVLGEAQPALQDGDLVIDCTTGDPRRIASLAEELRERGVTLLDASVLGSSEQVRRGQAILLVGGERPAVAAAADLLEAIGRCHHVCGPCGAGQRMKLVANLVLGLNRAALAEGLHLARRLHLDLDQVLEILRDGAAYSRVMDTKARKMIDREYDPPQARVSQHRKDVDLILDLGRDSRAALPMSQMHLRLLQRAEAAGLADLDNSAIIEALDNIRDVHARLNGSP